MKSDEETPTWRRWWREARILDPLLPADVEACELNFGEEEHALAAVLAGQGVAICSDVVLAPELARGELVKAHELSLPGCGYYLLHVPEHSRRRAIGQFAAWLRELQ